MTMTDIPKERRDELRNEVGGWESTRATVMPTLCAEIHALLDMADERDRLREELEKIRDSPFCDYRNTGGGQYGIGVTDGHRYCAQMADEALNGSQS